MTPSSTATAWSGSRISASSSSAASTRRPAIAEYPLPVIKPGYPIGTLDLETDKAGDLWIAMMYQGGVAKFDKATGTFQTWKVPEQWQTDATQQAFLTPTNSDVDGKVWVKNSDRAQILRLDPVTGQWENLGSFKDPSNNRTITSYGIPADHENNLYLLDFSSSNIGKLDAKTGKLTGYTVRRFRARGRVAAASMSYNRLWFAEYGGNAIGMLDPKTEKIQEWVLPTPWAQPRHRHRQERRSLDRLDAERPRVAARSQDRRVRRISVAEDHQYPPGVRG